MTRPCDLCQATDSLDTPGDPSGKIRICSGCGFVHVKERRSVEDVANAWEQIYDGGGYDPNWPGVRARLFYVAEWIDANLPLVGRRVLDIGAGDGTFLGFVRSLGAHPVGIDPSLENIEKLSRQNIYAVKRYAADASPDIGQFDIVTLNWTLENTADCLEVLRYAKRQLKPDGYVVVATGSRILVPFKKPLSSYLPQDPDYPHDTHCFRWSSVALHAAFNNIGLSQVKYNDFYERDEMIYVFGHSDLYPGAFLDSPWDIQNHFRRWQEQFP